MERCAIVVHGIVQGVGFRPFVYRLASEMALAGFVRNECGCVRIEVEGASDSLTRFCNEFLKRLPPLAVVDDIETQSLTPIENLPGGGSALKGRRPGAFRIERSRADASQQIVLSPDVATCDDCLRELLEPSDPRYLYPFLNCTNCGPRLTIIRGAPYDRERTTMSQFAMCPRCRAEYLDPGNRRFHAQPTACAECGPRLHFISLSQPAARPDPIGPHPDWDAITTFADAIRAGKIGALKGLGGYHLVCDAANEEAVSELRRRKHRDEKPLAIMLADLERVQQLCEIDDAERKLLLSPRRPIVLLRRKPAGGSASDKMAIAPSVALANPCLGIMLPYTPVHHLLARDAWSSLSDD